MKTLLLTTFVATVGYAQVLIVPIQYAPVVGPSEVRSVFPIQQAPVTPVPPLGYYLKDASWNRVQPVTQSEMIINQPRYQTPNPYIPPVYSYPTYYGYPTPTYYGYPAVVPPMVLPPFVR